MLQSRVSDVYIFLGGHSGYLHSKFSFYNLIIMISESFLRYDFWISVALDCFCFMFNIDLKSEKRAWSAS